MEITFITVIQNLFLASIILMAFSIPKTIMIIIWMKYSTWIFTGGALKMLDHKRYGSILKNHLPQITIDKLKDDDSTINQIVKGQKRALEQIKMPMIEAIISIILMLVSLIYLDFKYPAQIIVYILIIILVLSILYLLFTLSRFLKHATIYINDSQKKQKSVK